MSASVTMRHWMGEHHGRGAGRKVEHNDRFLWLLLAVGIVVAIAVLSAMNIARGGGDLWLRPVPEIVYPFTINN